MLTADNINVDFANATNILINYYNCIQSDILDNKGRWEIAELISQINNKYSSLLKDAYGQIWLLFLKQGGLNTNDNIYHLYKTYFQDRLHQYFLKSPFCNRVYKKPLGYAGDYIMMKYIYDNILQGKDAFAKYIHHFSTNIEIAQAVRSRKKYIVDKITNLISSKSCHITNIACGAAVEIIDSVNNNNVLNNCTINLLDSDNNALNYIKNHISQIGLAEKNIIINFFNNSIINIITNKTNISNQDLIYSVGLFDYLSDKLFSFLNKGGILIVGNLKSNELILRSYMELLGEWLINYRNEKDLLHIASMLNNAARISIEKDCYDIQLYLIVEKI